MDVGEQEGAHVHVCVTSLVTDLYGNRLAFSQQALHVHLCKKCTCSMCIKTDTVWTIQIIMFSTNCAVPLALC